MRIKQLAERMGASVQQLDVELKVPCNNCKKMGGSKEPAELGCTKCEIQVAVKAKNE